MSHLDNITRIKAVSFALEELSPEVVFVGGAVVSLYSTRPEVETRSTDDVDIVVEIARYKEYAAIEEKLRSKGFVNDVASGVICRYLIQGIIVDVMPTSEEVLGFSNKWYPAAFAKSVQIKLDDGLPIRIFSAPYFLATKLEAFTDRGENEGRFSPDFEDIVHVLNNRETVWEEIKQADESVKRYLKSEFEKLLGQEYIGEWISVHLEFIEQKRVNLILGNMSEFVQEYK
jgi:predicted nucleotidyltransferase